MPNRPSLYAHFFLPGETTPVLLGKLFLDTDNKVSFSYDEAYLAHPNSFPIFPDELPLVTNVHQTSKDMFGCFRDAAPDSWGRKVILNRMFGFKGAQVETGDFDEFFYLKEANSNRIGALDFTIDPEWQPREPKLASIENVLESIDLVQKGEEIAKDHFDLLSQGTSIGGARPKAFVKYREKEHIAKFSMSPDEYSTVKFEYIAMKLAELSGIKTSKVHFERIGKRDVLLIERFDRLEDGSRKHMLSALTLLGLGEMTSRYASYPDFLGKLQSGSTENNQNKELFSRMVFNVISGNTDDHARNHAVFWDGNSYELTPVYDICPQIRYGNEASQAMNITAACNLSNLSLCIQAAESFGLDRKEAEDIIQNQLSCVENNLDDLCKEAGLSFTEKRLLQERCFLNEGIFAELDSKVNDFGL